MPEIDFTIDPTTGQIEVQVQGMHGPSCQDVAKLVAELVGKPAVDQKTSEYYLKPTVRPQIQPKRSP